MTDDGNGRGVDLTVTCDTNSVSKEDIKNRMDEYLTASKLGRMAFVAGDIQLAKDRFNLAMSLEVQIEIENNGDFGVTGGLLREELQSRYPGTEASGTGSDTPDRRIANILSRLQQVFEYADEMAGIHPKSAKWYSIMGSCLCVVNEWEKAGIVYREGLKVCPRDKHLSDALQNLEKLKNGILAPAGTKHGTEQSFDCKPKPSTVGTASSLDDVLKPKFRPVNRIVDKQVLRSLPSSLPSRDRASTSVTSREFDLSRKMSENCEYPRNRPRSVTNARSRSLCKPFTCSRKWEGCGSWKSSFSPTVQALSLEGFNSRTLQTMRIFNTSSQ